MSSTLPTGDEAPNFEQRRREELEAGRARLREINQAAGHDEGELNKRIEEADGVIKEDEKRRDELLQLRPLDTTDRDRAGAEVADQAQTELEAIIHLADRAEPILTAAHEIAVEELDHPDADTERAELITTDMVTAQAVNQPVVLANERGVDTESKPMNPGEWDERRIDTRLVTMPAEKHVPRTRQKAEKVSRHKIPRAEEVVVDGWHEGKGPNPDAAVKEVARVDDPEALG